MRQAKCHSLKSPLVRVAMGACLLCLTEMLPGLNTAFAQSSAGQSANPLSALQALSEDLLDNQGNEFLDPEQAFVLSVEPLAADRFVAQWDIADGYYLYRKRFDVKAEEPGGQRLGPFEISRGETKQDEYFGEVEVYYQQARLEVPVIRFASASGELPLALAIRYQGCADAGLCYPPITKRVTVRLPASGQAGSGGRSIPASGSDTRGASDAAQSPASRAVLPEQDRIAASLAGDSVWLALASFFGFGLLLTFTPCVLPMVPILSGIIVGQGQPLSAGKAFRVSATYVGAMALTYTALGVAAGLSGAGLQAAFQDPRLLVAFAAVFVLLSLSMFGFYELQVPAGIQERLQAMSNRQQGGTYLGAAVMGLLSALIVGPCIAPPLAGALIYIGQTGDAALGGMALFAMSMGMGVPLLIVGTSAGRFMPRTGPWMNAIKAVFGVLLLGVAIYLLERVVPAWLTLLMWAALLIVTGVYLGALEAVPTDAGGWRRLWKGTGVIALVYGVLLMVGAAIGNGTMLRPLQGLVAIGEVDGEHGLRFRRVKGVVGLEAALSEARAAQRPVMLDYYADWCVSCKEMETFTFPDPGVRAALGNTLVLQTDVTANDEADQALLRRFRLFGPPAILFFGPDGRERRQFRVVGYLGAAEFAAVAQAATTEPHASGTAAGAPRPSS